MVGQWIRSTIHRIPGDDMSHDYFPPRHVLVPAGLRRPLQEAGVDEGGETLGHPLPPSSPFLTSLLNTPLLSQLASLFAALHVQPFLAHAVAALGRIRGLHLQPNSVRCAPRVDVEYHEQGSQLTLQDDLVRHHRLGSQRNQTGGGERLRALDIEVRATHF